MTDQKLILVVEDSADCAATLEMTLAPMAGIEVHVVRTAEAALAEMAEFNVAAVITDIQLPGITGLELVAQLRLQGSYSRLPVLVISGTGDHDVAARALQAGAAAFFSKPFSPLAVRQKLEALLDAH